MGRFVEQVKAKAEKAGFRVEEVYGMSGVVIGYKLTKTFNHIYDVNAVLIKVVPNDRRRND